MPLTVPPSSMPGADRFVSDLTSGSRMRPNSSYIQVRHSQSLVVGYVATIGVPSWTT